MAKLHIQIYKCLETRSWAFKIRHKTGYAKYTGFKTPQLALTGAQKWLDNYDEEQ